MFTNCIDFFEATTSLSQFHSGRANFTFDTLAGRLITAGLEQLSKRFDLSFLFGTAPRDFTISRCVLGYIC